MTGRRDNDYGRGGPSSFGGGWGNQRGESWNRERPGERGWYGPGEDQSRGGGERHYARGEREGWFSDSRGGERGARYGGSGDGGAKHGSGYGSEPPELRGGSFYGAMTGEETRQGRGGRSDRSEGFGGDALRRQGGGYGGLHDPHYSEWRQRQIEDLDRDYEEYRREHQSKFESEFGSWRSKRQGQRQALNRAAEHMEVVGSDGSHVGTVDKVAGDRIVLTRSDENAGGVHHWVPCGWVETVDERVTLNRTSEQAMDEWRSEERSRALFEREESGSDGPRMLDRSFSGTYGDRDRDRDNGGGDS